MRNLLYFFWLATLGLGLFCLTLLLKGVIRDNRIGQPDVSVNLASAASSAVNDFRIWRAGEYDVLLSSVNHSPPFDIPFGGKLDVTVSGPDGNVLVHRMLDSSSAHMRPNNMSWTLLDSVRLERRLAQKSRLTARVIQSDSQFSGVTTRVHLRLRQYDPGMGGLANYVMILPGILFVAISLGVALSISQHGGGKGPLWITLTAGSIVAVLWIAI